MKHEGSTRTTRTTRQRRRGNRLGGIGAGMALALASYFAATSSAFAQVNAETLRVTLRQNPNFLWLDGSLASRAGNTQGMMLSASIFGGVTRPPHLFFGKGSSDYATAQGVPTVARSLVHLRYNYETTRFLSLELLTQVQHDKFRRLAIRDLYGTGLRFNWIQNDDFDLFSGTTILLEQQGILSTPLYPGRTDVWVRSSNYFGMNIALGGIGQLNSVTYVQPRLDRPKDFRVIHETVVTFGITKRLAARIGANLFYDREPPQGVIPADFELKNTLAVKF